MIDLASAAVQVRVQRGVFLASLRMLTKNPWASAWLSGYSLDAGTQLGELLVNSLVSAVDVVYVGDH